VGGFFAKAAHLILFCWPVMKSKSIIFSISFFLVLFLGFISSIVSAATIHDLGFIQDDLLQSGKAAESLEKQNGVEVSSQPGVLKGEAAKSETTGAESSPKQEPEEIQPEWRTSEPVRSAEGKKQGGGAAQGEKEEQEKAEGEVIKEEDMTMDVGSMFTGPGPPTGGDPVEVVAILDKDLYGGNIHNPSIVHYDPGADEIYVVEGGTNPSSTVTIYGADYFPVAALGKGRGITSPTGLDLDEAGNIYFALSSCENGKSCLKVLNPAFFLVTEVYFSDIKGVPDTFQPGAIAVSKKYIFLAGYFTKGVLVLDRDYNFVRWLVPIMIRGKNDEVGDDINGRGTHFVDDVVVDENDRVYILSMEAGRIFVLDRFWNFRFSFGEKGGSSAKLSQARSLAVDVARQVIYVCDYMRHAVNLYNYVDGKYLFEIGGLGFSPGWFRHPLSVTVDGRSNLIVADYFNNRVQVLFVP